MLQVLDITTLGHRKRILASLRCAADDDRWSQGTGSDIVDIVGAIVSTHTQSQNHSQNNHGCLKHLECVSLKCI